MYNYNIHVANVKSCIGGVQRMQIKNTNTKSSETSSSTGKYIYSKRDAVILIVNPMYKEYN